MRKTIILLLFMLIVIPLSVFAIRNPENNWQLNRDYNDSMNVKNGSMVGNGSIVAGTLFGGIGYLNLDGTGDYVKLGWVDNTSRANDSSFSMRIWVKRNSLGSKDGLATNFRAGDGNLSGYRLVIAGGGVMTWTQCNEAFNSCNAVSSSGYLNSTDAVFAVHIVYNATEQKMRMYVNGTLNNSQISNYNLTFGNRMCQAIGAEPYKVTNPCDTIDSDADAKLWNYAVWYGYALTSQEVFTDFSTRYLYPVVNSSVTYPINNGVYNYTSYNGSILIYLDQIKGGARCWLNDTRWTNQTGNLTINKSYYSFYKNVDITRVNNTITYYCNDSTGNWSNGTINFIIGSGVRINVYDEKNRTMINFTNVTIHLIGEFATLNLTTSLGYWNVEIINGDYEIRVIADGYSRRSKYVTLETGLANQTIDMYLLLDSISSSSILKVIDEDSNLISNLKIVVLREDPTIFDTFYTVNEVYTNFEGESISTFERNNYYYKFEFWYNNVLVSTTQKTFIFQDTLTHQIQLGEDVLLGLQYLFPSNTFMTEIVNNSGVLEVNFTFSGGNLKGARVEAKRMIFSTNDILVAENSTNTTYGFLNLRWIPEPGAKYIVTGFVDTNTENSEIPRETREYLPPGSWLVFGLFGVFVSILIVGFFALISPGDYRISIVFTLFGLAIVSILGLMPIKWIIFVPIIIVGIMIIIFSRGK